MVLFMKYALKIENLSKTYNKIQVVDGINLAIEPGEILGLLGPNGAGKSTTINMISGVTKIDGGKISVFGFDNQANYIEARRRVGVMHQEIVTDTFFTIDRALKIHSGYYGVKDDPKWRELLIERLALGPHLKKSMNRLSGGMKRRFMVAKALIHKPELLILDEPTAGVDVELRRTLWDFVREMNRQGTTVLLTTHYLEEAEEMCGRIAIMNKGKIVTVEPTKSLVQKLDEKRMIISLKQKIFSLPDAFSKAFPCELLEDGMRLSFHMNKNIEVAEVLRAVSGANLQIEEIETQAPKLEDVFLKLTGSHHAN